MFQSNYIAMNTIYKILNHNISKIHKNQNLPIFEKESDIIFLLSQAISNLNADPSVISLTGEFKVIGDIHGNLSALIRYFNKYNYPPQSYYLFLGDYVDRGEDSSEVLFLLYSLKILFPSHIYLLRGNHECDSLTTQYGFKNECISNFSQNVYSKIIESFNFLPIAAILNNQIFCVHGGLSPSLKCRDDIFKLVVKTDKEPTSGVVGDLLWSDFEDYVDGFVESERGCGYICGGDTVADFLKNCSFSSIVRSHQECDQGYIWPFGVEGHCLTIFGSPDYMEKVNDAAVAIINAKNEIECNVFHPLFKSQMKKCRTLFPEWILTFNQEANKIGENDATEKLNIDTTDPKTPISEPTTAQEHPLP